MGYLTKGWGRFFARLIFIGYACISILACAWAAKLLADLVCAVLLESHQFSITLFFIMLLAVYGGISGLEARARVYEIMFWVLAVPFAIMLCLSFGQVQAIRWFPLAGAMDAVSWSRLWVGAWQCFAAFLPLAFLPFLVPHIQDRRKIGRAAAASLAISGIALTACYFVLLGIFGSRALSQEEYAVITLMGMIKIPGDFVKRLDTVMVGVWFFTLYALIGATLYHGVSIAAKAFRGQEEAQGAVSNWWFLAAAAFVYGIAFWFYQNPQAKELAEKLFSLAGMPFLVLVPVLSVLLYERRA